MPALFTSSVTFKPTLRNVKGQFTRATAKLVENQRKASRRLAKRWVAIAKQEAPKGKGQTKTRVHGDFRRSIDYQEMTKGAAVGFTSTSEQPLGTFITHGTKPHKIKAKRAKALYFYFGKVRMWTVVPKKGGFKTHVSNRKLWVGKGFVNHPGTKRNDYVTRAYVRWTKDMEEKIEAVADRFVIDVVGNA